jgi:hypothetical protein
VEILITEGQLKRIIAEQTKPTPVKPKNKTYTTVQDRVLTRDALTGSITIPKGTRFTAHQDGDRKSGPQPTYTASVDRIVNGKRKPSTVFYCTGKNAGKFWNGSSNSWYYDKTKVLSGFLTKNLCTKSFGDQYYYENADEWREAKDKKEELSRCSRDGQYVNAKGGKDCYHNSTEFKKNYDFLKSQGLNVDGLSGREMPRPQSPSQHFNLSALFSIKDITDFQADKVGWNNKECMSIGLASIGNVKMKSKLLNAYDLSVKSLIDDRKSPLYTLFSNTVSPSYANFFLSDFYFQWSKLVNDVNASVSVNNTVYFPDGVYNFMATYYGTTNVSQIKNTIQSKKAGCQGGGLTAEQGHQVLSTLTFVSAFIPVVGPFIAAGLGTVDAAILYNQGKKGEAALTVALSLIPFVGKIPALKGIGQEVFKSIALKTASKVALNPEELLALEKLTNAKAEFDAIAKEWVASKTKSTAVQEVIQVVKKKGEGYVADKVKEVSGVKDVENYVKNKGMEQVHKFDAKT